LEFGINIVINLNIPDNILMFEEGDKFTSYDSDPILESKNESTLRDVENLVLHERIDSLFPGNPVRQDYLKKACEIGEISLDFIEKNVDFLSTFKVERDDGVILDSLLHIFIGDSEGGLHDDSYVDFHYDRRVGSYIVHDGFYEELHSRFSEQEMDEIERGRVLDIQIQKQLDIILESDEHYQKIIHEEKNDRTKNSISDLIKNHKKSIKNSLSEEDKRLINKYEQEYLNKIIKELNYFRKKQTKNERSGLYYSGLVIIDGRQKLMRKDNDGFVKHDGSTFFPSDYTTQDILSIISSVYYDDDSQMEFNMTNRQIIPKYEKGEGEDIAEIKIYEANIEFQPYVFAIRIVVDNNGKIITSYPIQKLSKVKQ